MAATIQVVRAHQRPRHATIDDARSGRFVGVIRGRQLWRRRGQSTTLLPDRRSPEGPVTPHPWALAHAAGWSNTCAT
jgi:hypothetical protein